MDEGQVEIVLEKLRSLQTDVRVMKFGVTGSGYTSLCHIHEQLGRIIELVNIFSGDRPEPKTE